MGSTFEGQLNQIATDKKLRTSSLFILSKMDQADLEALKKIWPTIATERRRDVMRELLEISEENFEVDFDPVFFLGMADQDPDVRALAVGGLWENEQPALIGPLLHLLQADEAAIVRAAAASALGRFIYLSELEELDREYIIPIKKGLLDTIHQPAEDIEVRRRAVESVSFLGEAEVRQIVENAYYDDDEKMQVSAIFAMGRSADITWCSRVIAELDNPNSEIRFEAARACGELEAAEAVSKLIELIDTDPDLQVQEMSIWALGRIGGSVAREGLEICTGSENEAIAQAAEDALDEINLFGAALDLFDFEEELDSFFDDCEELDDHNGTYILD